MTFRPLPITIRLRDTFCKSPAIELCEVLVKTLHLKLPFALRNERPWAYNQHGGDPGTRLQFFQNQSRLDRLSDADIVRNENTWAVPLYHPQCRSELIGNKINPRRI